MDGWIPILSGRGGPEKPEHIYEQNMHKPCLAQHAAFLVQADGGDAEWLRSKFYYLQAFLNNYRNHHRHSCGLYFWQTDMSIGVDNDPCTYYRPPRSSGAIYLNALMLKELEAICLPLSLPRFRRNRGTLSEGRRRSARGHPGTLLGRARRIFL